MEVRKDIENWAHDMQAFREASGFRTYDYKAPLRSHVSEFHPDGNVSDDHLFFTLPVG